MKLLSLIRQTISSPTLFARMPSGTSAKSLRPPAVGQRGEDIKLWQSQLKEARSLCSRLAGATDRAKKPASERLSRSSAPDMPLRASTRVALERPLNPEDDAVLHASWLSKGIASGGDVMLLASPRVKDARAWAAVCDEHRVDVVVDLGSLEEARTLNHCMRSTAPAVFEDCAVSFTSPSDPKDSRGFVAVTRRPNLGEGAESREVRAVVRSHVDGVAVPADTVGPSLVARDLTWLRIPSSHDEAIGPRPLLEFCRYLKSQDLGPSRAVAIMSPGGDRRSAVYGAAWDIQRKIDAGGVTASLLSRLVEDVCARVRAHRDPSALGAEEDIASLLAFATLAQQERSRERGALG